LSPLLFRSLFSKKGHQEVGSTYWIAIASQSIPPDTFRFQHQSVFLVALSGSTGLFKAKMACKRGTNPTPIHLEETAFGNFIHVPP